MSEDKLYDIHTTGRMVGLTPSVLRVWEDRYGWPKPHRTASMYRMYTQFDIDQLKRVAEVVRSGVPVGQVIVDGMPRLPAENGPARPTVALAKAVPPPTTPEGRVVRAKVDAAIDARDTGALTALVVSGMRYRESDRLNGIYVPAIAYLIDTQRRGAPAKGIDRLQDALVTALGGDVLRGVVSELRERLNPQLAVEERATA